jgi:hypothetical protein
VHTNPKLYGKGIQLPVSHEKDVAISDVVREAAVLGRAALDVSQCLSSNYVSLPAHSTTSHKTRVFNTDFPQILLHFLLNTTKHRKTNKTFLFLEE